MSDPLSVSTSAIQATAGLGGPAQPLRLDPNEARSFAAHMQGPAAAAPAHAGSATAVPDWLRSMAEPLQSTRAVADMQRGMMAAVNLNDPTATMVALTNFSFESTQVMTRLHLCTSLASSVTSLFSGLLKNQQ
jgi:hypothetical protein